MKDFPTCIRDRMLIHIFSLPIRAQPRESGFDSFPAGRKAYLIRQKRFVRLSPLDVPLLHFNVA
jgi:hypothetical protein